MGRAPGRQPRRGGAASGWGAQCKACVFDVHCSQRVRCPHARRHRSSPSTRPVRASGFLLTIESPPADVRWALLGMHLLRQAKEAFEEGQRLEPEHADLRRGADEAERLLLAELLSGAGRQRLALPPPLRVERITSLPHSAPRHAVSAEDTLLPTQLLTPKQAENDSSTKDTYNYLTIQADIRLPARHLKYLQDECRLSAFETAIAAACKALRARDLDVRALHLGCGAGLLSLLALRHGAVHVTCVEHSLYLAMAAKDALQANGVGSDMAPVLYRRPCDVAAADMACPANLLILDGLLEDGLLASGLIPSVRHALTKLVLPDASVVVPAAATLYVQAVSLRTTSVSGFDLSAINSHRWHAAHSASTTCGLAQGSYEALSAPTIAFGFDFKNLPGSSESHAVDVMATADGTWNAVLAWYELEMGGGVTLSTGPASGVTSLHASVHYLQGELPIKAGEAWPLRCSHNTVRLHFTVDEADYIRIYKPDPTFPVAQFGMVADESRLRAYDEAICRQVAQLRARGEEVHAIDLGAGSSAVLSMMAARAGATSVVAAELHASMAVTARRVVAANSMSKRVTVVARDVALLQRGRDCRAGGCNLAMFDLFDAGLVGDGVEPLLREARRAVLQPGAAVVPCGATLYCMGVECLTRDVRGCDMGSSMNQFRWDRSYSCVRMSQQGPYRRLTAPRKVTDVIFAEADDSGAKAATHARENLVKLEVTATGLLNCVVFWFDLHLDAEASITNSPPGVGPGGILLSDEGGQHCGATEGEEFLPAREPPHHWGQALQYLERSIIVSVHNKPRRDGSAADNMAAAEMVAGQGEEKEGRTKKAKVPLLVRRDEKGRYVFSVRETAVAADALNWAPRAPWLVTWGGGASVESPHRQRVHYCELLVSEFLQRVKCRRFPPIANDLATMVKHAGSLHLDGSCLEESFHELCLLESLHLSEEFSIFFRAEALSRAPLERWS